MTDTTASRTIGTTLNARLRDLRGQFQEEQRRRRVYAETRAQLAALTDRELLDIGLSRLQIADVARDAAYGMRRAGRP